MVLRTAERSHKVKKYTDKRYNKIAVYVLTIIAITMLMVICIFKFSTIWNILGKFISALAPAFWGFAIAFILNPLMMRIDGFIGRRIFSKKPRPKLTRALSVTAVTVLLLACVCGSIAIILPSFIEGLVEIFKSLPSMITTVQDFIDDVFKDNEDILAALTSKLAEFSQSTTSLWEKIQPMLTNLMSSIWSVFSVLNDFIIGIIISIYLLYSKENLMAQIKKVVLALSKKTNFSSSVSIINRANKTFSGFVSSRILDSIAVGVLCWIVMFPFGFPYATMISIFVGITNIIPFFGPFIGAIPSAILILLVKPSMTIWFIIFMIVLQQFDGNILSPKITGETTGLPAIWVLVSILIGGGLFGFLGMLLAVPAFALIYDLAREFIVGKLKQKKLPTNTASYKDNMDELTKRINHLSATGELSPDIFSSVKIPPSDEVNQAK